MNNLAQVLKPSFHLKTVTLFLVMGIFWLFSTLSLSAQSTQNAYIESDIELRDFDRSNWENTVNDLDYSGTPPAAKPKTEARERSSTRDRGRDRDYRRHRSHDRGEGLSIGLGKGFFTAIVVLFGIALLAWIILSMTGGIGPKNKRIKSEDVTLENIEENIHETELEGFIRKALEKGDFPLAIRLYYLAVIKELSLKKIIKWKRDKTNGEYVREARKSKFIADFQELTLIFERIWYGGKTLDKAAFQQLEPKFKKLIQDIEQA